MTTATTDQVQDLRDVAKECSGVRDITFMKKFEYNYSVVTRGEDAAMKEMDAQGANGWEVISIHYKSEGLLGTYAIFFKREVIVYWPSIGAPEDFEDDPLH